ncbi:MAG TPA: radical SAM protein [Polyangium sp.]|nr:radical SAM protein [Polyangium sp.]
MQTTLPFQDEPAHVVNDTFILADEGSFIIYAPLAEAILRCNETQVRALIAVKETGRSNEHVAPLQALGIVHRGAGPCSRAPAIETDKPLDGNYKPTKVTLFPTNDCNLACTYCYSRAGETNERLRPELAKKAIDILIQNALDLGREHIQVNFHGGGEPFHNFDLVRGAIEYGRAQCAKSGLRLSSHAATNGILNPQQLEWLCDHLDAVSISIDGPPDVQDVQRPLKLLNRSSSRRSSDFVVATIRFLESRSKRYGLRCTITDTNVDRLRDLVDFFRAETSVRSAQLEPVFVTGRCHSSGIGGLDARRFLTALVDAYDYGMERGFELRYSGSTLWSRRESFCGADGRNFFLTPEGHVSACNEVSRKSDYHADRYIVGQLNNAGMQIDETKVSLLRQRRLHNLPNCQTCFAKHNCAGDCAVKMDDPFDTTTNERCYVNRGILLHQMRRVLTKTNKQRETVGPTYA